MLQEELEYKLKNICFDYIDKLKLIKDVIEEYTHYGDEEPWDEPPLPRLCLGMLEYEDETCEEEQVPFYEVLYNYDFSIDELNMLLVYIKNKGNYFKYKYDGLDVIKAGDDILNNDYDGDSYYTFLIDATKLYYEEYRYMFIEFAEEELKNFNILK